jgi:hypothetical protein
MIKITYVRHAFTTRSSTAHESEIHRPLIHQVQDIIIFNQEEELKSTRERHTNYQTQLILQSRHIALNSEKKSLTT